LLRPAVAGLNSFFIASIPFQRFHRRLLTPLRRDLIGALPRPPAYLIRVALVPELFDVVHHAIELPLPIDLGAPAQREAVEPLVVSQVAEHRFDRGKARANHLLALARVDAPLHPLGV
jgi:hypothetical protein